MKAGKTDWQGRLFEIIFESDTPAGRLFDLALLWCILISVATVLLESIDDLNLQYGTLFRALEWSFTLLFTIEYILRILCVQRPKAYIFSFFGIIDFMAIIPTYLSLFVPGAQYLLVVRIVRLLRVFRILRLFSFVKEAQVVLLALRASLPKITVFLGSVFSLVVIIGALMYLIEGPANGFTSIPTSMYWAIVTLTTVGYGDITPHTTLGQILSALVMVTGYSIIAVPTGIVSVELARVKDINLDSRACHSCLKLVGDASSKFCRHCGSKLNKQPEAN